MKRISLIVLAMMLLTACGSHSPADQVQTPLAPYADVRVMFNASKTFKPEEYRQEDLRTYTFNEATGFSGSEELKAEIMEQGKNPGLGVRALHDRGIDGRGVNVAIIDQNLLLHHPEFDGKIIEYHDTGCETPEGSGSLHGPAVAGLLVGNTIGTAPGARVYYAAAPSWKQDSQYYADALDWIIETNQALPTTEKIRMVSISAAPAGEGSPFKENHAQYETAVENAQAEGILVLDCRMDDQTGFISPAYYGPDDPDNMGQCTAGWPSMGGNPLEPGQIGVPCSYRTVPVEYEEGEPSYEYNGEGGLSWGIPYAAGVLAMGWQVNPSLSSQEMVALLNDTCYVTSDGSIIIDPNAFISAVQETG